MNRSEREFYFLQRRNKGITQQEIADAIGVSVSYISKFEKHHVNFDEQLTKKYKDFINNTKNSREILLKITV